MLLGRVAAPAVVFCAVGFMVLLFACLLGEKMLHTSLVKPAVMLPLTVGFLTLALTSNLLAVLLLPYLLTLPWSTSVTVLSLCASQASLYVVVRHPRTRLPLACTYAAVCSLASTSFDPTVFRLGGGDLSTLAGFCWLSYAILYLLGVAAAYRLQRSDTKKKMSIRHLTEAIVLHLIVVVHLTSGVHALIYAPQELPFLVALLTASLHLLFPAYQPVAKHASCA